MARAVDPGWNASKPVWTVALERVKEPVRGDAQSHCVRIGAYAWCKS
jgi:hypothetical protein